jgi:hypothetical protein
MEWIPWKEKRFFRSIVRCKEYRPKRGFPLLRYVFLMGIAAIPQNATSTCNRAHQIGSLRTPSKITVNLNRRSGESFKGNLKEKNDV